MVKAFGKAVMGAINSIIDPLLQSILKEIIGAPFRLVLEIFNFVEYAKK